MFRRLVGGALNLFDMKEPNIDSNSLIEKIKNSKTPIVEHNFGTALGSIYFIKADPTIDFEKILDDILDEEKEPNPQKTRSTQAWMAGGPMITARSGEDAMRHHKLFVQSMRNTNHYTDYTLKALDALDIADEQAITLRTLTTVPIYNMLARGMLDMDKLPAGILDAFERFSNIIAGENTADEGSDVDLSAPVTDAISNFAKNNFNLLRGTYYSYLLATDSDFRAARDAYVAAAKNLVQDQKPHIKAHLQHYANGGDTTNILALSVIELYKEEIKKRFNLEYKRDELNRCLHELLKQEDNEDAIINELLGNEYMHTIPINIMASINLRDLIPSILHALASDPALLESLRNYLTDKKLSDDFSNMHSVVNVDKRENGLLNRLYLEGLRLRSFNEPLEELQYGSNVFRYYLAKPFNVGGTIIPANSVICILNGMKLFDPAVWGNHPEKFDSNRFNCAGDEFKQKSKIANTAFSHAPRVCPGHMITEYMCKTFIAYLAMNFDFTLIARPNETSITKTKLKFTVRKPEVELDAIGEDDEVKFGLLS